MKTALLCLSLAGLGAAFQTRTWMHACVGSGAADDGRGVGWGWGQLIVACVDRWRLGQDACSCLRDGTGLGLIVLIPRACASRPCVLTIIII